MKNKILILAASLLIVTTACKKETETPTISGLLPSKFSYVEDGQENKLYVIRNDKGMEATVINIGARIVSITAPDKNGNPTNVVTSFDNIQPFLELKDYHGAIVGRYANRIGDGKFQLDRVNYQVRTNEGNNQLHGGPRGFGRCFFTIEQPSEQQLVCTYLSKHLEEGYPGNLNLTVTYTLTDDNTLNIDYQATTDQATVINVSNHAYFNLSGSEENVFENHKLYIDAAKYTPTREDLIPTGEIAPVTAVLDMTTPRTIDPDFQYDLNYVLNHPGDINNLAGKLQCTTTGIGMEIYTTEPGLQFYNDKKRPSYVLETQHFPDSPNQPEFPTTVLRVDSVFNSRTIYKFTAE
ncbi:MAG: galactose mutarotase [Dysgonamonadaceae bacterium]|jgi:aldose 1-epimerase|nr:galactose mutarotase [Dysgonamonadaceae bacterium]